MSVSTSVRLQIAMMTLSDKMDPQNSPKSGPIIIFENLELVLLSFYYLEYRNSS